MIRVILQGRTGNNLFQYAAGRTLADKLGTDLLLDGSWADPVQTRHFESIFRLPLRARYYRRWSGIKRCASRLTRKNPVKFHHGSVFLETVVGYAAEVFELPDGSLLSGHFQNPGYVDPFQEKLRQDLNLEAINLPRESLAFAEKLKSQPTVSLHVRCGDYLNIPATQCLTENYYDQAISKFRNSLINPSFCVFSDDIPRCRRIFKDSSFIFCDLPASRFDPLHDLKLMASCTHHIIANSSYSWWGAWLNPFSEKRVIAPSMWMENVPSNFVIPSEWISI